MIKRAMVDVVEEEEEEVIVRVSSTVITFGPAWAARARDLRRRVQGKTVRFLSG